MPKTPSRKPLGRDGHYPVDPIVALLRDTRVKRNLKRLAVAERIGCSPSHLAALEHGMYEPKLHILRAWCDVLGVDLAAKPRPPAIAPTRNVGVV